MERSLKAEKNGARGPETQRKAVEAVDGRRRTGGRRARDDRTAKRLVWLDGRRTHREVERWLRGDDGGCTAAASAPENRRTDGKRPVKRRRISLGKRRSGRKQYAGGWTDGRAEYVAVERSDRSRTVAEWCVELEESPAMEGEEREREGRAVNGDFLSPRLL